MTKQPQASREPFIFMTEPEEPERVLDRLQRFAAMVEEMPYLLGQLIGVVGAEDEQVVRANEAAAQLNIDLLYLFQQRVYHT